MRTVLYATGSSQAAPNHGAAVVALARMTACAAPSARAPGRRDAIGTAIQAMEAT